VLYATLLSELFCRDSVYRESAFYPFLKPLLSRAFRINGASNEPDLLIMFLRDLAGLFKRGTVMGYLLLCPAGDRNN